MNVVALGDLKHSKYSATSCSLDDALEALKAGSHEIKKEDVVLGRKLGEGAMAVVHEGMYRGGKCAIKKLKKGIDKNSKQYKDLLVELDILASMGSHDNLVCFYGACLSDTSSPIIVVELMEGMDLESYLSRKRPGFKLGQSCIYHWSLDLLRALDHLHNRDPMIIHRDVKPENLLLTKDRRTLKLSDFGLCKKVTKSESGQLLHKGSTGTLRYMAPEVLGSLSVYTDKADVYSAALVIWYLLTGYKPNVDIRETPDARPNIAPAKARWAELADIIERMWHREPNLRPTAGESIESFLAVPNIPLPLDSVQISCCRMA